LVRYCFALAIALPLVAASAAAQDDEAPAPPEPKTPKVFQGVGVDEQRDTQLPLDLEFFDEDGNAVRLGDYFQKQRPVILTLNYYRCPQLCGLQLNGMVDALQSVKLDPGTDFEIVTISFDPMEGPQLAKLKKQSYVEYYGHPGARNGWHFLTGHSPSIQKILESTGYGIRFDESRKEWAHAAAMIVCTPDGRISRYLYGIMPEPKTVRLTLVEASQGKIGTPMDQVLLYCFQYDGDEGKYTVAVFNIMRGVGGLTLLALGALLFVLWRREWRKKPVPTGAQA
jgi:protein SCO1/2